MFGLKGKKILVTGASSGIGRAIAISCSQQGAELILSGRDEKKLVETQNQLVEGNHQFFVQDLGQPDQLDASFSEFLNLHGKIDGFVHAAGMEMTIPLSMMRPHHFQTLFAINVIAGFELCRIITKKKFSPPEGASIVFISSVMAKKAKPGLTGYCSTKGALESGMRPMALELAPRKIRVNCIAPGYVETGMTLSLFNSISEIQKSALITSHPLGLGAGTDIGNVCVYLLSDQSSWITGTTLTIDGGYSLG